MSEVSQEPLREDQAGQAPGESADPAASRWKPLRIWPLLFILAGMVALPAAPRLIENGPATIWMAAAFGPAFCGLVILLWWIVASRATLEERLVGFFGVILVAAIAVWAADKTMFGPALLMLTIPMGTAGFAIGTLFTRNMLSFRRTWIALALATLGFGFTDLLRSEGIWGNFAQALDWRWTPTKEEQFLANADRAEAVEVEESVIHNALESAEWPAFRGASRTGQQHGVKLATNWESNPPQELWKVQVGPGWSSFSVAGNFLFTQEQRGDLETTVCYEADTGREVWKQQLEGRFEESAAGPGPRATPTITDDGLYVMNASGPLLRLDPANGQIVWQQNLKEVADPPMWGFSSSPLVADTVVIVHAGDQSTPGSGKVLGFDKENGELRWSTPAGNHSYSSPQLVTLDGVPCVLMLTNDVLLVLDPATGSVLLNYEWKYNGYRSLQPQVVDGDSLLLPTGMGTGTRRIHVDTEASPWTAKEEWTSMSLKPDFNDFVVHNGHAYGFDGSIFASIDLATGKRNWKRGRYGTGQVLLLADSDLLLVMSEAGDVVLLEPNPEKHVELASFKALEGKTWNHPVVVGDRLYVRNGQEAACFKLPTAESE